MEIFPLCRRSAENYQNSRSQKMSRTLSILVFSGNFIFSISKNVFFKKTYGILDLRNFRCAARQPRQWKKLYVISLSPVAPPAIPTRTASPIRAFAMGLLHTDIFLCVSTIFCKLLLIPPACGGRHFSLLTTLHVLVFGRSGHFFVFKI